MDEHVAPEPEPPASHPYAPEIEAERRGWYELVALVRSLTRDECLAPGYYSDPDWSVRDVVAHVGTWLAQAQAQFEQMSAGSYEGHDLDIDALNALFLDAMSDQPWEVTWLQANAARSRMIDEWYSLAEPSDEAAWWIRKSAADHFDEHLGRLREWVAELTDRRGPGVERREPRRIGQGATGIRAPSCRGTAATGERPARSPCAATRPHGSGRR